MTIHVSKHHGKSRRKGHNPKAERTQRQALQRAVATGDFDDLPSRLPSRQMRTFEAL